MMAHASSCPSTCAISASGTGMVEVSVKSRTRLLLVRPGHEKTHDHAHHQRPQQNSHHPDLYRERWVQGHHIQAEFSRQGNHCGCLCTYGMCHHRDGVRCAIVELEAL